jgi:hypothetical protein
MPERGGALGGDGNRVACRAGDAAGVVVDDEVVTVEAADHGGAQRHGFDGLVVSSFSEAGSGVARSVGGVCQHRQARFLFFSEFQAPPSRHPSPPFHRATLRQPAATAN